MLRPKIFFYYYFKFRFISTFFHKETPLHLALQECKERMINFLLEKGANPNIRVLFLIILT